MNKTAIKNFAISARKKLIAMAKDQAGIIGITAEHIAEPAQSGSGFAVYPTHFGTQTTLTGSELSQRASLVRQIQEKGFDAVMEEVAYTWFNRLIAVRFMEVNDYLPSRVRVLSSETAGKAEPDLVTLAPNVDLGFTPAEVEEIYALKDDPRKSGELFKRLFIKQCNALGEILPKLFEKTADYTELLLDIAWDKEDGVVRELLTIDEKDFDVTTKDETGKTNGQVEIIGWMYQYYNTEPKQKVFDGLKKNVKITKENIPAATQLFTPDWIVRYMVENSLGRLWLDGHSNDTLKTGWKYYLDEAEQEAEVQAQLDEMRKEYKNLTPEDIKIIDPCMGSGHILVYAFEVLIQIYVSCGYAERDAASLILEKNLYGLDIDKRAYQLTYFAVMMKGRQYDRRFLTRGITPQVYCPDGCPDGEEYGSLLLVDELEPKPEPPKEFTLFDTEEHYQKALNAWNFRRLLAQKYDVVVTNPPYMGASNGSGKLNDYIKKHFPDSKADLFACFIERCGQMTKQNCYTAMITQHSWMFLSSFEKLRAKLLLTDTVNMAHLGARAFEEIGGEVVQTTSWVQRKSHVADYKGTYARLVDYGSQQEKENAFLAHSNLHTAQQENFSKIPGSPIAYWLSDTIFQAFVDASFIKDWVTASVGIQTGDNDKFLHSWWEISFPEIFFNAMNVENTYQAKRWFPYNKGGEYRKWYGNDEIVVDWRNDGENIKRNSLCTGHHYQQYADDLKFQPMVTWSRISSGSPAFRFKENGYLSDMAGFSLYSLKLDLYILIAFCNSAVAKHFLEFLAPTLNFMIGPIISMPLHFNQELSTTITEKVEENLTASKSDWDSFETSWDFKRHPLV